MSRVTVERRAYSRLAAAHYGVKFSETEGHGMQRHRRGLRWASPFELTRQGPVGRLAGAEGEFLEGEAALWVRTG
jgi:hypothetical protein